MTKTKSTKRALLMSGLALLMCVSMLIGSTFAWFTDSVTSAGNKIVSGNLDIDLYMWNSASDSVEITNESAPIFGSKSGLAQNNANDTLWEPGKTQVVYLSLKNNGSLDLKYKVAIDVENPVDGKNLYEVMQYAVTPDAKYGEVKAWETGTSVVPGINASGSNDVELKKGEEHFFALSIHMDESAGNEYMDGQVNFDIKVMATQLASEFDSFDNQYDKFADYDGEISGAASLEAALTKGGTYKLLSDLNIDSAVSVPADVTVNLDLDGKTLTSTTTAITNNGTMTIVDGTIKNEVVNCKESVISNKGTMVLEGVEIVGSPMDSTGYPAYTVSTSGKLTIEEGTTISANRGAISMSNGADLVINGGKFVVSNAADGRGMTLHTIYAYGYDSKLTINDGYFEMGHTSQSGASVICPAGAAISVYGGDFRDAMDDTDWKSTGNFQNYMGYGVPINVYGGTYDDTTFMNHVVDGYEYGQNADGIYTVSKKVVPDGTTFVSDGLYVDADGVYYITKAAGFDGMREKVAGEQPYENDGTWILYNDIDLNGVNWTPIAGFHGIFDGNDKTISNMNASFLAENKFGGGDYGVVCTIKDVTFNKANVTGTQYVGVVVGRGTGVTVENVKVTESTVIGTKYVGGIIGAVNVAASTITDCSVTGSTIKSEGTNDGDGKVGGIVGFLSVGKATGNTVTGCTISGYECVGGIAGRGGSGDGPATIYGNTVSSNNVTGTDTTTVGEQIGEKLNVKESE